MSNINEITTDDEHRKIQSTTDPPPDPPPDPPIKKKRGRKPKSVLLNETQSNISNLKLKLAVNKTVVPEVVRIQKSKKNVDGLLNNYEKSFCEYNPDIIVPNAYNKEDNFTTTPFSITNNSIEDFDISNITDNDTNGDWKTQTDTVCHWCCHSFTNVPIGIPVKFSKQKSKSVGNFYCVGNFCSFSCACAHNYTVNDTNTNVWERFNLLQLLSTHYGFPDPIKCAKPRETLKMFGGELSIEQFRKSDNNVIYFKNKYPMISVSEQVEELCNSFSTANTELFTIKKDNRNVQTSIKSFY